MKRISLTLLKTGELSNDPQEPFAPNIGFDKLWTWETNYQLWRILNARERRVGTP